MEGCICSNPGGPYDPETITDRVVEAYDHGRSLLDVARELWSLTGDDARAKSITDLISAAYDRELPIWLPAAGDTMVALLDPLPDALAKTGVDDELFIGPERMAQVRADAHVIDVREERGDHSNYGVVEAVSRAFAAPRSCARPGSAGSTYRWTREDSLGHRLRRVQKHGEHATHLTGFLRITAEDLAPAQRRLAGNPVFEAGGTIEIRDVPRG